LLTLALALAVTAGALTTHDAGARSERFVLMKQIDQYRAETWRWQRLMQRPRTPTFHLEHRTDDDAFMRWIRNLWRKRADRAERAAHRPPHRGEWLCIHRYERHPRQGWATNTGNGYYGGLQMDISFQRTYGPEILRKKGTANRWSPVEQMWVAERAHRSGRGFYPWPNTARYCGLI
jgi:hypothetical protein